MMRSTLTGILGTLLWLGATEPVTIAQNPASSIQIATKYYMVMFGYQGPANLGRDSHTFATFVKATGPEPFNLDTDIETHDISWIPANISGGEILCTILFCKPQTGKNYSLHETMLIGTTSGRKVRWWGPYEINEELFQRAVKRVEFLNSGKVRYKALDDGFRGPAKFNSPGGASNCVHAVSDIGGDMNQGLNWGYSGSQKVVKHLRQFIKKDATAEADWLIIKLGVRGF